MSRQVAACMLGGLHCVKQVSLVLFVIIKSLTILLICVVWFCVVICVSICANMSSKRKLTDFFACESSSASENVKKRKLDMTHADFKSDHSDVAVPDETSNLPNQSEKPFYHGYMTVYFKYHPPIPQWNVIIDNSSLAVLEDRQGTW